MEHNCSSNEDSDYEKPSLVQEDVPPLPPLRTLPCRQQPCNLTEPCPTPSQQNHLSLCHTLRTSINIDFKIPEPEGPVKLSQFITRYSALLPCQVKLCQPLVSATLPLSLPQSSIIQLHCIKHTKVVLMKDIRSGEIYSAPVNSAVNCGLLFDPNSDVQKALKGFQFQTAGEIMAMKPLPSLVKATQCYRGNNVTVEEGEILQVLRVKHFLRLKHLKVQNLQKESKQLSEKCLGAFTTAPRDVSIPLSTLFDLDVKLPQKAVIFEDITKPKCTATQHVVMLEKIAGETCLIASCPNLSLEGTTHCHLEFFSDTDVEVEIAPMDSETKMQVVNTTKTLFSQFHFSKPYLLFDRSSKDGQRLQNLMHSSLTPGREQTGMQLLRPPMCAFDTDREPYQQAKHREEQLEAPPIWPHSSLNHDKKPKYEKVKNRGGSGIEPYEQVYIGEQPEVQSDQLSDEDRQDYEPVTCQTYQITPLKCPTPVIEVPEDDLYVQKDSEDAQDCVYVCMARLDSDSAFEPSPRRQSPVPEHEKNRLQVGGSGGIRNESVQTLSLQIKHLSQRVRTMSDSMTRQDFVQKEIKSLQSTVRTMQKDIEQLKKHMMESPIERTKSLPDAQSIEFEKNRQLLAALDCNQVII